MAMLRRRESPPPAVLARLNKGERFLSWADTPDGRIVAATSLGLWWPDSADESRRIPWSHVDKVVWRDNVMIVTEADVVDDLLVDRPPVAAPLATPRDLPPTVRKRVEANVVRSDLALVAGGTVRFVARRQPGRDGVVWWARLEPGTPDTEQVRAAVRARLARLRASAGVGGGDPRLL